MKNNPPSSEFEHEDKCPSCGSPCNIHTDLDDNDECNECRNQIDGLEMGQIIPKEEPKQTDEKERPMTYWGGLAEPKQETLEEVAEMYSKTIPMSIKFQVFESSIYKNAFITGAKWQMERSYSEEDMLKSFMAGIKCESNNGKNFQQFIKQFKKKIRLWN